MGRQLLRRFSRPHSMRISQFVRNLGTENVCSLNPRHGRQKFWGLGDECFGDRPVEVSLSVRFAPKRIEDGERRGVQAKREPQRRGRFLIGHLQSLSQERGELLFLTRFGLESYKQSV